MLVDAALSCCNHLLTQEGWARGRLQPFVGQTARLEAGALSFSFTVTPLGFLRKAASSSTVEVCISLPPDKLWRLSEGPAAALGLARISGRADFADTLAFLLHHLRWDAAADLAPVFGDIVAQRLVTGFAVAAAWQKRKVEGLALNLAEYLRDESHTLVAPCELQSFRSEVACLDASLEAFERRLARLGA